MHGEEKDMLVMASEKATKMPEAWQMQAEQLSGICWISQDIFVGIPNR